MKDGNYPDEPPPYSQIAVTVYPNPNVSIAQSVPNAANIQYGGGISQHTYATSVYPHQPAFISTQPIATAPPMYGATERTVVNIPTEILVIGGCPACRIGVLQDEFSCLGVCCAIVFFPIGILCCLAMKTKRCSNCGMEY